MLIVDWDGTITERDSLLDVLEQFGDWEECERLGEELFAGKITLREEIDAPVRDRDRVAGRGGRLGGRERPRAARAAGARALHPLVVSSGFHELIDPVLAREGVEVELQANRVEARPDGWRPVWRELPICAVCGQPCKRSSFPPDGEVVYVGDGYSDRCGALAADRVFARRGLADVPRRAGRRLRARSTTCTQLLLRFPEPYDFEISTERFRAFGPDVANLWHEGGLHRVVGGREVRIEAAPGGVASSRSTRRSRRRCGCCSARRSTSTLLPLGRRGDPVVRRLVAGARRASGRRSRPIRSRCSSTRSRRSRSRSSPRSRSATGSSSATASGASTPTRSRRASGWRARRRTSSFALGFSRRKAEYVVGARALRPRPRRARRAARRRGEGADHRGARARRVDGRLVPRPPPRPAPRLGAGRPRRAEGGRRVLW